MTAPIAVLIAIYAHIERNPARTKEKFVLVGLLFSFQWDSFYWDFVLTGFRSMQWDFGTSVPIWVCSSKPWPEILHVFGPQFFVGEGPRIWGLVL